MRTPVHTLAILAALAATHPAAIAQENAPPSKERKVLIRDTSFPDGDSQRQLFLSPERRQEIKAQQSAYLTRRMNLTPEEAQRFWPIYNRFDEEMEAQRKAHREGMKDLKDQDGPPSEAEANTLLDQRLAMREQEQALRRKYDAEFRKSIGAVKTWELYQAERDFHREMLRGMRQQDGRRPPPGRQRQER